MTPSPLRGLTPTELVQALDALRQSLLRAEVVDVSGVRERDDLLIYLRSADPAPRKLALQVAAGGPRGRICPTERRFAKFDFALGPGAEVARNQLLGAVLADAETIAGERIAVLRWRKPDGGELRLVVELFGNRGLWLLLAADERIVALSRLATSKDRAVALGDRWSPPVRRPDEPDAALPTATPRFASLVALDRAFTAADEAAELAGLRDLCARSLERALAAARARCAGLQHQLAQGDEAARLRGCADLMLAYAHTVRRGAVLMRVPDPARDGEHLELPLAPDKPVVAQAQALYERARRLEDALGVAAARLAQAQAQLAELTELATQLGTSATFTALTDLRDALVQRKLLRAASAPTARAKASGTAARGQPSAQAYRRFVSIEGYEILCGKTNEQNDRLSLRTARGNDIWLHIGRGHAGSHVVVKLPKGKTASLETLLDAATIAVHFSKARGAAKTEVIYTQAKHVRKPKGAPAGAVVPHQTKTLGVRLDEARLQRLLGASGES